MVFLCTNRSGAGANASAPDCLVAVIIAVDFYPINNHMLAAGQLKGIAAQVPKCTLARGQIIHIVNQQGITISITVLPLGIRIIGALTVQSRLPTYRKT